MIQTCYLLFLLQCSGAAPLPRAVAEFFFNFDIPICQLYGMSESTGIACMNAPGMLYFIRKYMYKI